MNEAKGLTFFSWFIGAPAFWYLGTHLGWDVMLAILFAMWAQNCWLNAKIVQDMEDSYEVKEAARAILKKQTENENVQ